MITIQYGGWTPDLANVSFQMPDQQGPVTVPVADCLNVYFVNGVYQSIETPMAVSGGTEVAQVVSAFTYGDTTGLPLPIAGTAAGNVDVFLNGAWVRTLTPSLGSANYWGLCQFGTSVYIQMAPVQLATISVVGGGLGGLWSATVSSSAPSSSLVTGAPYGLVLGVVGQFVMVGDVYVPATFPVTIGTGDGVTRSFSNTLANAPLMPTSVEVVDFGGTAIGIDNGQGSISGTGISSGSIFYGNGFISVTFAVAPAAGHPVKVYSAAGFRSRLQWSAIGNGSSWPTPLTNAAIAAQSGINDLEYEYGPIMFISGYPLYGVIFQRNAITRAGYIGGNVVFNWQTYARNQGLLAKGAAVQVGANTYFLSDSGFFYTDGANVVPIGTAQDNSAGIDQWFFSNVNLGALSAIRSGYDARARCIFFAIPTGSNTLPDTLLTYNVLAGRWTRAAIASETIWIDSDGSTDRLGLVNQSHQYCLLTGTPSTGYLESCDLSFSDGYTRFTPSVRPNIACTDTPTAMVGTRNTLESAITYSAASAADAFGGGFAGTLVQKGVYTRIRVSSAAASAMNGATAKMRPGGAL